MTITAHEHTHPTSSQVGELLRASLLMFGTDSYGRCGHEVIGALQDARPRCAQDCACELCAHWRFSAFAVLYRALESVGGYVATTTLAKIDESLQPHLAAQRVRSVLDSQSSFVEWCRAMLHARQLEDEAAELRCCLKAVEHARLTLERALSTGMGKDTIVMLTKQRVTIMRELSKLLELRTL